MTNQHPIIPPLELVQQWWTDAQTIEYNESLVDVAAQWGADQELEACITWLRANGFPSTAFELNDLRRPKPPSLKELALKALKVSPTPEGQVTLDIADLNTVRRALEALPND